MSYSVKISEICGKKLLTRHLFISMPSVAKYFGFNTLIQLCPGDDGKLQH